MKKFLALFLALVMALGMVACSGNEDPDQGKVNVSKEVSYPLTTEDVTFTGLIINATDGLDMKSRTVWDTISEITGVKFKWIHVEGEALAAMLAGGSWDFDFILHPIAADQVLDYGVEGGRFVNYYEYLEYMPNLQKAMEDFPLTKKAMTEINGEMYGLPRIAVEVTSSNVRPYYNTEKLAEVGVTEINTIDDFYNALKLLKEKTGTWAWSPDISINENSNFMAAIYGAFGDEVESNFADDGEGNIIYNRTSEQYKRYLQFMNKLYEEGLINPEFLTADNAKRLAYAADGRTAFYASEAAQLTEKHFASGKVEISCLSPLTSEYDSTRTYSTNLPVRLGGGYINAKCKNIELLCKVFDIAFAEEEVVEGSGLAGISFWYGVLGKDLIINEDGSFQQVVPEGFEGSFAQYQGTVLKWNSDTSFGRDTMLGTAVTSEPGTNQARQIAFRDKVQPFELEPSEIFPAEFIRYTTEETLDRAAKFADVDAYVTEMRGKFITGVADIDTEWDDYIDGLYARGLDVVLEITQDAYDRYLES